MRFGFGQGLALLAALAFAVPARAEDADDNGAPPAPSDAAAAESSVASSVYGACDPQQGMTPLAGDPAGVRSALAGWGIKPFAIETAEILGNVSGGVARDAFFEGRLQAGLCMSLGAMLGKDSTFADTYFYADMFQIHGRGLSANDLHNLFTVSSIEASRATRLHDLFLEQGFLGGNASLRAGQLAADDEFITTLYGSHFVNAMFGWPALPSIDLPAGGPAYPFATPGLRIKAAPSDGWTFLAAVFNGDPAGPVTSGNQNPNPQLRDRDGLAFNFNSALFAIAEAQYAPGVGAVYKLGGWYNSDKFADPHVDRNGLSLASPASTGIPRSHVDDYSVYAVADQMIWPWTDKGDQGIAGFLRAMGAPSDRNLISFYVDGGLDLLGPFGQPNDAVALGVAYGHVSGARQALDRDFVTLTGTPRPIEDYEAVIELTYQKLVPTPLGAVLVQPDFQYVIHPGGHVSDPNDPTGRTAIPDAAVLGLRTTITF